MKYGLPDDIVKRISAAAFAIAKKEKGNPLAHVSNIYHTIGTPETLNIIALAHNTDAMNSRFTDKEDENSFKSLYAKTAAINRGTLEPIPMPKGQKAEK